MAEKDKKYKVIIVDDDKFLLDMYAMKLQKEDVEVETFENGEGLLANLGQENAADLLLLDIIMPGLDGVSVLEKLKERNFLKKMKVIMLTNQGDPAEVKRAEALGAEDYIVKATAVPSEVIEKVMKALKKK
jgi:CheY-like chemotaxis protein